MALYVYEIERAHGEKTSQMPLPWDGFCFQAPPKPCPTLDHCTLLYNPQGRGQPQLCGGQTGTDEGIVRSIKHVIQRTGHLVHACDPTLTRLGTGITINN